MRDMKKKMGEMRQHMKAMQGCMKEMEDMMGEGEFDEAFRGEDEKTRNKKGML